MGFFSKVFVNDKKTGELVDIIDLDKEHYEAFLGAMSKLNIAYSVAMQNNKRNDISIHEKNN